MRQFQVIAFLVGVVAFLASACFTGKVMGDTLWKVGVAIMIGDIVCILLWPSAKSHVKGQSRQPRKMPNDELQLPRRDQGV
jgi:hypothetical protein